MTERDLTAAQIALAWLLQQGEDIVPIPGTPEPDRLEENAVAVEIQLSRTELQRLEEAFPADATPVRDIPRRNEVSARLIKCSNLCTRRMTVTRGRS